MTLVSEPQLAAPRMRRADAHQHPGGRRQARSERVENLPIRVRRLVVKPKRNLVSDGADARHASKPAKARRPDLDVEPIGQREAAITNNELRNKNAELRNKINEALEIGADLEAPDGHAHCGGPGVSWAPRVSHRFVICPGRPESMT
jgi:hypothetical protein